MKLNTSSTIITHLEMEESDISERNDHMRWKLKSNLTSYDNNNVKARHGKDMETCSLSDIM